MSAITEYFRAHRHAAAVMHFTALGYSRPDGQTSDEWIDVEKLTWDPDFYKYVRDAFAPVGLMLDIWEDELTGGVIKEFPVIIFNDFEKEWKGEVQFRLSQGGTDDFNGEETGSQSFRIWNITNCHSVPPYLKYRQIIRQKPLL